MSDSVTRLENLYRDVGPSLLAYLQRRFGDVHAAEDLLHETFFQAARRQEGLTIAVSPRAWLFGIAKNLALTAHRRRRATCPLSSVLTTPEATDDPRLELVREAVGRLPAAQREALELRLREGLSYSEIASALAIPVGTVRSRLHHAVHRLRASMAEADE